MHAFPSFGPPFLFVGEVVGTAVTRGKGVCALGRRFGDYLDGRAERGRFPVQSGEACGYMAGRVDDARRVASPDFPGLVAVGEEVGVASAESDAGRVGA